MIREAVRSDIPRLVEYGKRHHEEKRFDWPFDAVHLSLTFANAIESRDWLVLIGEEAVLLAVSCLNPLRPQRHAVELLVRAGAEGLETILDHYETWARSLGCSEGSLACTDKHEAFARLYGRHGYAIAETVFSKRL